MFQTFSTGAAWSPQQGHHKESLLKGSTGTCQAAFAKMVFSCAVWLGVPGKGIPLTAQQAAEGLCASQRVET